MDLNENEINTIKDFFKFIDTICEKHHHYCEECPLHEYYYDEKCIERTGCSLCDFENAVCIWREDD